MNRLQFWITTLILVSPIALGQPTTSEAPIQKFTPSTNPLARRIVSDSFTQVEDLNKVDPDVLAVFHTKVRPEHIANRGERFNPTDVVTENLPARRFVLAGSAPGIWFILYEHGGIAHYHNLVIFLKDERWQIAAALQGSVKGGINFDSLKQAVKAGQFFRVANRPDF